MNGEAEQPSQPGRELARIEKHRDRLGVVYSSSDRYAAYPATQPTPPCDLAATIYHLLGIDPHLQLHDALGRPMTLCESSPIQALLS